MESRIIRSYERINGKFERLFTIYQYTEGTMEQLGITEQSFTIKGRLPGYNELKARCWQESARRKADAVREVQIAAMAAKIKPVRQKITVTIRCFEPNAKRDVDNVTAGAGKVILDALQEIGVLAGDGRKYIEQVIYSKVEVDRKNPRIEVEMEICEENKGA